MRSHLSICYYLRKEIHAADFDCNMDRKYDMYHRPTYVMLLMKEMGGGGEWLVFELVQSSSYFTSYTQTRTQTFLQADKGFRRPILYIRVSQPRGRHPTWGRLAIFVGSRETPMS